MGISGATRNCAPRRQHTNSVLVSSGVPESTRSTRAGFEFRHDLKFDLHDGDDDELCDALAGLQRKGLSCAVQQETMSSPW